MKNGIVKSKKCKLEILQKTSSFFWILFYFFASKFPSNYIQQKKVWKWWDFISIYYKESLLFS